MNANAHLLRLARSSREVEATVTPNASGGGVFVGGRVNAGGDKRVRGDTVPGGGLMSGFTLNHALGPSYTGGRAFLSRPSPAAAPFTTTTTTTTGGGGPSIPPPSTTSAVGGDGGGGSVGDSTPKSRIISDALTCGLCLEPFTDETGLRLPLSLPCGHCFCKACLTQLHKKECPNDRKKFPAIDTLPRNYPLLDIVNSAAKFKGVAPPAGRPVSDLSTAELEEELQRRKTVVARIVELSGVLGEQALHEAELSAAFEKALTDFQSKRSDMDKAAADLEVAIQTRIAEAAAAITAEMRQDAEAETARLVTLWSGAAKVYEESKAALHDQRSAIAQIQEQLAVLGSSSSSSSASHGRIPSPSPSPSIRPRPRPSTTSPSPSTTSPSPSPSQPNTSSPFFNPNLQGAAPIPSTRPTGQFDTPSSVWGPGTFQFVPLLPGSFGAGSTSAESPSSPRLRAGDGRPLGQRHRSSSSSSPSGLMSSVFSISPTAAAPAAAGASPSLVSEAAKIASVGVGVSLGVGVGVGWDRGLRVGVGAGAGAATSSGNPFHVCACPKCGGAGMGSGGFIFGRKRCECECVPNSQGTAGAGAGVGTGAGAGAEDCGGRCACGKSLFDRGTNSATASATTTATATVTATA